jgi:guanine nucleotide exchange factor
VLLFHEAHRIQLDEALARPTVRPDFPPLQSSSPSDTQSYWAVPSALTFENIGFSRNVGTIKYLVCADCDCGPLGWHDTEGADLASEVDRETRGEQIEDEKKRIAEFLLAVDRVRYETI